MLIHHCSRRRVVNLPRIKEDSSVDPFLHNHNRELGSTQGHTHQHCFTFSSTHSLVLWMGSLEGSNHLGDLMFYHHAQLQRRERHSGHSERGGANSPAHLRHHHDRQQHDQVGFCLQCCTCARHLQGRHTLSLSIHPPSLQIVHEKSILDHLNFSLTCHAFLEFVSQLLTTVLEHALGVVPGEGGIGAGYEPAHRPAPGGGVMVGINAHYHHVLQL